MRRTYMLGMPIVAVPVGATASTTLPSGASIEIPDSARAALVQVIWQQRSFMVNLADLLGACRVEDVGEINWPERLENSVGAAE